MLLLGQHPWAAIGHVACWKAGLVSVPASPLFGADAIAYRLNNVGVRVVITDLANLPTVAEARLSAPSVETIFLVDGSAPGASSLEEAVGNARDEFNNVDTTADDPAFINFTSGTTGNPKGALQAHRSMLGHLPGVEMGLDFFPQAGRLHVVARGLGLARWPDGRAHAGLVAWSSGPYVSRSAIRSGAGVRDDRPSPGQCHAADADDASPDAPGPKPGRTVRSATARRNVGRRVCGQGTARMGVGRAASADQRSVRPDRMQHGDRLQRADNDRETGIDRPRAARTYRAPSSTMAARRCLPARSATSPFAARTRS